METKGPWEGPQPHTAVRCTDTTEWSSALNFPPSAPALTPGLRAAGCRLAQKTKGPSFVWLRGKGDLSFPIKHSLLSRSLTARRANPWEVHRLQAEVGVDVSSLLTARCRDVCAWPTDTWEIRANSERWMPNEWREWVWGAFVWHLSVWWPYFLRMMFTRAYNSMTHWGFSFLNI